MKATLPLLSIALLLTACTSTPQQTPTSQDPTNTFRPSGKTPAYPWHLTNIWWFLESPQQSPIPLDSLTIPITVHTPLPKGINLYLAPLGDGRLNGTRFYAGLLTNTTGWPSKTDQRRINVGPGGIFSRWGKSPVPLNLAQGPSNALYESADYEGHFLTVRRPYRWNTGTHHCTLKKSRTQNINGQPHTWFTYRINGTHIGSLAFPGNNPTLSPKLASFVEIYQTSHLLNSPIPKLRLTLGRPIINGKKHPLTLNYASYPTRGPSAGPPAALASPHPNGQSVQITLTPNPQRQKTTPLLPSGE